MDNCKCAELGHNPGKLEVGDVVCEYCSTLACADLHIPSFGADGEPRFFRAKGRPEGCVRG